MGSNKLSLMIESSDGADPELLPRRLLDIAFGGVPPFALRDSRIDYRPFYILCPLFCQSLARDSSPFCLKEFSIRLPR